MIRSNPVIDRFFQFFLLPKCFFDVLKFKECTRSHLGVALDLIKLFFSYKTFPDHYQSCRLWEVDESKWKYYYGSSYQSHQRAKLVKEVSPREYRIVYDDKDISLRLCRDLGIRTPETFGMIKPDQNYKKMINSWITKADVDTLFIKPILGCGGHGIVLAKKEKENIYIKSKTDTIPLQKFRLHTKAIVQKAVKQDPRMKLFNSYSLNTIRIITFYTREGYVLLPFACMRYGRGNSYVDNWSSGGIAAAVNIKTGAVAKYAYDKFGNRFTEHPSSKVRFEGFNVPKWDEMIEISCKIQHALDYHRLLGIDLALDENGELVIIEVNDNPDISGEEQETGPLFLDKKNLKAFGDYDLLINKHQKILYSELKSTSEEIYKHNVYG